MGAVIAPPVLAFYSNPQSIDDLIDHTVGRVVDLFGLEMPQLRRWTRMRGVTELSPRLKRPDNAAQGS
jgi:4-hydroxy-3-polyprenylbenzoate decarboxylase